MTEGKGATGGRGARGSTPWREASWCALDFELTGLDPDRDEIISFGAIPLDAGRVRLGGAAYGLVRPERELGEPGIRVHGIRASDLARAPTLDQSLDRLLAAIDGRALVVHKAAIERAFLGRALSRRGLRLRTPVADTEVLGRIWLHGREGEGRGRLRRHIGLDELAAALGLPAEHPHDALSDALTTAQAFLALATHLEAEHPETVGSLTRAERRLESIRLWAGG